MVSGGGALGRWLGHEGTSFLNGISVYIYKRGEGELLHLPREDTTRSLQHRRGPHSAALAAWPQISSLHSCEKKALLFVSYPVCASLLQQPEKTETCAEALIREEIQRTHKHTERCSASYAVRRMQMKVIMSMITHLLEWPQSEQRHYQVLASTGSSRNSPSLLVGGQMIRSLGKTSWRRLTNYTRSHHTSQQSHTTPSAQRRWELTATQKLVCCVYSSSIRICQNLEAIKTSLTR